MGWKRENYVNYRNEGFKGLFPGNMGLVETSILAGILIKYEEDFIICSKIEEAMGSMPDIDILHQLRQPKIERRTKLHEIRSMG